MRYFIHLSYIGTNYSGWQRQLNIKQRTIQATIEDTLAKMLKRPIIIYGCGRTDRGVHASQYFAHVNIPEKLDYDPIFRINKMLPGDIVIHDFIKVPDNAQAQYGAQKRRYDYYIHQIESPFLCKSSTLYEGEKPLDYEKMQQAVAIFRKNNNFRCMCKRPDQYKHTRCTIFDAQLIVNERNGDMQFTITANRFLQRMIRMLVGCLFKVGEGALSLEALENCFQTGESALLYKSAPPQGLYLSHISYPYFELPSFHRTPLS